MNDKVKAAVVKEVQQYLKDIEDTVSDIVADDIKNTRELKKESIDFRLELIRGRLEDLE